MTAPAPSPAEQAVIDRFGIFEPEARVVEEVARALHGVEMIAAHWDELREIHQTRYRRLAAAAVAAVRAAQDGGAEEAVRRAADWLCKEYGELLDGDAEGPAGYWEFQARELLEALAPQAGDDDWDPEIDPRSPRGAYL